MWLSRLVREAQKTKKFLSIEVTEHFQTKKKTENNSVHLRRRCKEEHEEAKIRFQSTGYSGVSISSPVHRYFWFKFFFFFPLPADFLFPAETRQYSADTIRFGLNQHEFVRFGANRLAWEPNRHKSAPIWTASARVGKSTWHDAARTRGLRRPSRVAASRRVGSGCAGSGAPSVHPRIIQRMRMWVTPWISRQRMFGSWTSPLLTKGGRLDHQWISVDATLNWLSSMGNPLFLVVLFLTHCNNSFSFPSTETTQYTLRMRAWPIY